jgi:uncharacterized membrane protein YdjX (TVP38/TMEM64 family)
MRIIDARPAFAVNGSPMRDRVRAFLLSLLICLIVGAFFWLFFTRQGKQNLDREHLRHVGEYLRHWVHAHPAKAITGFVALYVALAILALPLWWLQIVGGCGFGLVMGVVWSQCGAVIAATFTVAMSHELAGEWFEKKIECRRAKLHEIDRKLGHNGLLVVMAVRLMHVIPFGLSNYAFGLIHIRPRSAAIGTLLGGMPAVALYAAVGAGYQPWTNWGFDAVLVGTNLLLTVPLALRYLKPELFERIGVE